MFYVDLSSNLIKSYKYRDTVVEVRTRAKGETQTQGHQIHILIDTAITASKFDLELLITSFSQGHVYSLIGGVSDDRLALMHLGYKHMQGLDGFPKDQNTAYGYYSNIGTQTSIDCNKVQDSSVSYTFMYRD